MMDQVAQPVFHIDVGPYSPHDPVPGASTRTRYGQGVEAQSVKDELGGFRYERGPAYVALVRNFGTSLRLRELKAIVLALKDVMERRYGYVLPPVSRNTKRIFSLLVKYLQDNYRYFAPMLDKVVLCDADGVPIELPDRPGTRKAVKRKPVMPNIDQIGRGAK